MGTKANYAIAIDPALMMTKAKRPPDPWQAKILRERLLRLLLNCSRQSGKTTVIACLALIEALYYAPSLTLILAPAERQSKRMLRMIKAIRNMMGIVVKPSEEGSTTELNFPNGSEIIALPAKEANVRGFSNVALLIIDEASRVPDDLYYAIRPMMAISGGRMVLLSTPFGKRGFFHKEWTADYKPEEEHEDWVRIKVTAEQCPRITAKFLREEKSKLPDNWYRQEYFCEFADTDDAVFSYEDVMRAMSDDVQPLFAMAPSVEDADVKPLFTT